ncbi:MAG: hypothetical protein ACJ72V_17350, partial [Nitrososphaeraceae archaeon]
MTIKKLRAADTSTTTTAMTSSNITASLAVASVSPIAAVAVQESERQRIENATQGLSSRCFNYLYNRVLSSPSSVGKQNALTICDYISSLKS